jgi:formylglycine-generating enzyme required for sulfatase activity
MGLPAAVEAGMVSLRAGQFVMGSHDGSIDEQPVHGVNVPAFAIGRTEVTHALWRAVMGMNPSGFDACGDRCPVERVSWDEVQTFLAKLSALTGKTYRLPSEAEWEYACRAGVQGQRYCGVGDGDALGWHKGNSSQQTHPVGDKQPNPWGLVDMSGNVREWVADCWHANYQGAPTDGSAWMGADCRQHVIRGGSWSNRSLNMRAAMRNFDEPAHKDDILGFRLATGPLRDR